MRRNSYCTTHKRSDTFVPTRGKYLNVLNISIANITYIIIANHYAAKDSWN